MCRVLKTPSNTTTTLVNHWKRHRDAYKRYQVLRSSAKVSAESSSLHRKRKANSGSLLDTFSAWAKTDGVRARKMTQKIAAFIASGLHSYSIVEGPGFLSLMEYAAPGYKVPSRTTFSRTVIPEMYASTSARAETASFCASGFYVLRSNK